MSPAVKQMESDKEMTRRDTHLGECITVGQVEDLMHEAEAAGNDALVDVCLDALECDDSSLREVARAIGRVSL